jgi:hydroxymethylpyrimidine pyrophosphatase-like HAD family hydrolase
VIREMPERGSRSPGRLLRHQPLPVDVARETLRWSRDHRLDPHLNHLEKLVIRVDDPKADDYSAFLGVRAVLTPDLVEWIRSPVTKVIAVAEAPIPVEALWPARREFDGRATPTVSHPHFLEFVAPDVTKGAAVHWLARRLGVPLSQAMAIGDQYGDLEMIEAVGHGVAMFAAPEPVRAVARYIAPSLEEEGAAQMIEELVLHRGRGRGRRAAAHTDRAAAARR